MKIFVAIPVYDGKLQIQTVKCLLEEQVLASGIGDVLSVTFLPSCSVPAHGRNRLVADFMKSGFDRLVFLDADVTFEGGSLLKLAHQPVDFVGGAYRFKAKDERYPVSWLPGPTLQADPNGLLEVNWIPTGFSSYSREMFQKFREKFPEREYEHDGQILFCYFQMIFADRIMHSDDTYFCKEWRSIGGKVLLDPEITLTHWDFNTPYIGHIGNWLRKQNGIEHVSRKEIPA